MNAIDLAIIGPPFAAGLLVLLTHVPLGREVLARGIIFLDLAVAQFAALGVVAAGLAGWEAHGVAVQAVAATAAVAGALLLHATERRWPSIQEALIGTAFVLAATGGLLLLAHNPHGGERLHDLLAGQLLWVGWDQVATAAVASVPLLAALLWPGRGRLRFYLVFALAVTLSVQLVGVFLVFASLIVPALAARGFAGRKGAAIGYGVGAAAYAFGLAASAWFDLPAGPLVVWCLAVIALSVAVAVGRTQPAPAAVHRR